MSACCQWPSNGWFLLASFACWKPPTRSSHLRRKRWGFPTWVFPLKTIKAGVAPRAKKRETNPHLNLGPSHRRLLLFSVPSLVSLALRSAPGPRPAGVRGGMPLCRLETPWMGCKRESQGHMAMVQNQWYHFGIGAFATHFRTYCSGDWDVHTGV